MPGKPRKPAGPVVFRPAFYDRELLERAPGVRCTSHGSLALAATINVFWAGVTRLRQCKEHRSQRLCRGPCRIGCRLRAGGLTCVYTQELPVD
jgi:hypothetical protein